MEKKGGVVDINPLALPRGKTLVCEICGQPAKLICPGCKLTYYCCKDHQTIDWQGIHEKTCKHIRALRSNKSVAGSEEERQKQSLVRRERQLALIQLSQSEAKKHLISKEYALSVPAGLQALQFSKLVYGTNSVDVVPAYLLLAEANMGLGRYKVAQEFLLFANWAITKTPDCPNDLRSMLHRNFGKLCMFQNKLDEALKELARDVYHCSIAHGPEHYLTAPGYYYMAGVFLKIERLNSGLAFYDKITEIYFKLLEKISSQRAIGVEVYATSILTEAQLFEAEEILFNIYETRKQLLGPDHIATAEAAHTYGMMKLETDNPDESEKLFREALKTYESELGKEHESTVAVQLALDTLNGNTVRMIDSQAGDF